jgi:hypothetical protein
MMGAIVAKQWVFWFRDAEISVDIAETSPDSADYLPRPRLNRASWCPHLSGPKFIGYTPAYGP